MSTFKTAVAIDIDKTAVAIDRRIFSRFRVFCLLDYPVGHIETIRCLFGHNPIRPTST